MQKNFLNSQVMGIISFVVLFVGLSITFVAWQYTRDTVTKTTLNQFNTEASQIEYALNRRIATYYNILYALQGFFAASDSVERREWDPFVKTARIASYPDISYVGYIELVKDADKEPFVEDFRNDRSTNPAGYPNFRISPEGTRSEYAVVKYISPENEESSNAFGFDVYSSPPRKAALDAAADTNEPTASEILNLATDNSSGFIIAIPIYKNGEPINTVEERRAALKGFATVAFKTGNLFANIISSNRYPDIGIIIYRGNDVLYVTEHTKGSNTGSNNPVYTDTKVLEIGGQIWTLKVTGKASLINSFPERNLPLVVGIGGTMVSFLLSLIMYFYGKRTSKLIQLQSSALIAAANAVVITDKDGIIQWVNPVYTKLTGYEPNEVIGKSTRILNSGKQDKEFYRYLWNAILAGDTWKGELTNKRKDGTLYQEEQMIAPVTDQYGTITNFIAIKQDVTVRKMTEEKISAASRELEESKKAMMNVLDDLNNEKAKLVREHAKDEAVFSAIGEGLVVTDRTGKIELVNHAFETITGWKNDEVLGKDMLDVLPKVDEKGELIPKENRSLSLIISGKTREVRTSSLAHTHSYILKDGSTLPIMGVVTPIIHNGKLAGAVQVFRDITKEKEIDSLKDEFVSIASHELRTPLTAIDGLVSMILDGEYGPMNDGLKQPLLDINSSSERLIRLVNDLLSLSRIQAGRLRYSIQEFELSGAIKDTVDSLQSISKKKGIELKTSTNEIIMVQGDPDKVKQILNNILGNSLKFTDKGSIEVSSKTNKDLVEISIEDTGIGISKEDQPKLFGKFQQLETSQGRPPGTGLGLHISRELARKMGGDVWLEKSEVGKGSTFMFSLPRAGTDRAKKTESEIKQEVYMHPDQKSN